MKLPCHALVVLALFVLFLDVQGQVKDSCHHRRIAFHITAPVMTGGSLLGLKALWYADYPSTSFHWYNDNREWLQMDKVGHLYSAYQLSALTGRAAAWACHDECGALWWTLGLPLVYLGGIEVMDGFARDWGASGGDIIANLAGSLLFHSQQWAWREQRILLKWSFHSTPYAAYRPSLLGKGFVQEMLKDYNGQTYWASFNLKSLGLVCGVPDWLSLAVGYGASGMTGAQRNARWPEAAITIPDDWRTRHFYLSPDIDLRRISTHRKGLRLAFQLLNMIKIPLPTMELEAGKGLRFHAFYF
jgi:hypothetical protein